MTAEAAPPWLIRYYVDGTPPPRGTADWRAYVRGGILHMHYPDWPSIEALTERHRAELDAARAKRARGVRVSGPRGGGGAA